MTLAFVDIFKWTSRWWNTRLGSIHKPSTKQADTNWIGNVASGKPFPRRLYSAGGEVRKRKKNGECFSLKPWPL